jgi:hypothetical protein
MQELDRQLIRENKIDWCISDLPSRNKIILDSSGFSK